MVTKRVSFNRSLITLQTSLTSLKRTVPLFLVLVFLALNGCLAIGNTTTVNNPSIVSLPVEIRAEIGDHAIDAAEQAVHEYLKAFNGPLDQLKTETAVSRGLEAARSAAPSESLTPEQERDLKSALSADIARIANQRATPPKQLPNGDPSAALDVPQGVTRVWVFFQDPSAESATACRKIDSFTRAAFIENFQSLRANAHHEGKEMIITAAGAGPADWLQLYIKYRGQALDHTWYWCGGERQEGALVPLD